VYNYEVHISYTSEYTRIVPTENLSQEKVHTVVLRCVVYNDNMPTNDLKRSIAKNPFEKKHAKTKTKCTTACRVAVVTCYCSSSHRDDFKKMLVVYTKRFCLQKISRK